MKELWIAWGGNIYDQYLNKKKYIYYQSLKGKLKSLLLFLACLCPEHADQCTMLLSHASNVVPVALNSMLCTFDSYWTSNDVWKSGHTSESLDCKCKPVHKIEIMKKA